MSGIPPEIAVSPIHHRPMVHAYAAQMGLVEVINQLVPTAMAVDPGTVGLGLVWETLSGRSPLARGEAFVAHDDAALLWGRDLPPQVLTEEQVGRVWDRLDAPGTRTRFTAGAGRAERRFGMEKPSGPVDPTATRVDGASLPGDGQEVPCSLTQGDSPEKRPALTPCVCSRLGGARAVPLWGTPEEGQASDKTRKPTVWSAIAPR